MIPVGLSAFLIPFALSSVLTLVAIRLGPRIGLLDHPDDRKSHRQATPLGGGIAIFAAVAVALLLVVLAAWIVATYPGVRAYLPAVVNVHAAGVLASAGLLGWLLAAGAFQMVVGWIDDVRGLSAAVRLAIESVLVLMLVSQGIQLDILPGLDWVAIPLTVLWVVGLTNALNFLDNMDGLSAGVAAIGSMFFAVVGYLVGDLFVSGCFLVLCGAVLGFLVWNWPPARIFMGDAGSNFLGFWIGVLSVVATFKTESHSHVTLLAPLCIVAVPIYDSLSVTVLRLWQGKSPFEADRQHFSHRLVGLGFESRWAVWLIYLLTFATGLGGVILYFVRPLGAVFVLLQVVAMLGVIATLEMVARRYASAGTKRDAR